MSEKFPPFQPEAFGARLRAAREAARLTQGELAQRVGAQVSGVSDWENGYRVPNSPKMLVALAHILKCTVDELLMGRVGPRTASEAADYEQGRADALRQIRALVEAQMTGPAPRVEGGAVEEFMKGPGRVVSSYPGSAAKPKPTKRPRTG